MTLKPGDTAVLATEKAQRLLHSTIPARVSYTAADDTPRVVPIWFHWNGSAVVLGSSPASPKLAALRLSPAIAVTIDTNEWPYMALMLRGEAKVEMVDGVVPEYKESARRYFGEEEGLAWIEKISPGFPRMARVEIIPTWAWLLDYGEDASPR